MVVTEEVEATPIGSVDEKLAAEIEEAVSKDEPAQEEPKEPETEKDTPVEDKPEDGDESPADQGDEEGEKSDDEPQGEESPDEPEGEEDHSEAEAKADELLTRAVRSGMSLKDAKTFAAQDADALERQVGLLETASKAGTGDEETPAGETADAETDPLSGIPDLDPEIYDEEIVKGFNSLKSIIREQNETIKGMSDGNKNNWFDQQVEALPVKGMDAKQLKDLNGQFNVLKSGYEAQGQEVADADVFKQATQMVLGEDIRAAVDADKAKRLAKREKQQTNRPGGPTREPKSDPFDAVADELDQKYFDKK